MVVIGNRSKARSVSQRVAQLGERRQVAGEGGGVAGDVGDRPRRAVDDLLDHLAAGTLAGRVEDDEVERLVVRRRPAPGRPTRARRGRLGGRGWRARPGTPRASPRRPPPARSARPRRPGTRRRARRRRTGRAPAPPARGAAARSTVSTSTRGASTCDCQKPSGSTRKSWVPYDVRRRVVDGSRRLAPGVDQAVVDLHHLVGAVHVQPAAPPGRRDVPHPGAPAQRAAAPPRPRRRRSSPASRRQLLADHGGLEAPLGRRRRRAGSRSRRSSSGPAYGQGAGTRSARGRRAPTRRRRARTGRRRCPRSPTTTTRSPGSACRTKTTRRARLVGRDADAVAAVGDRPDLRPRTGLADAARRPAAPVVARARRRLTGATLIGGPACRRHLARRCGPSRDAGRRP